MPSDQKLSSTSKSSWSTERRSSLPLSPARSMSVSGSPPMSDIKLGRIGEGSALALPGQSVAVEKTLQTLIERHLETLLGVRFLASEYSTGKVHGGRIDTLGIDENGSPVIIE